MSDYHDDWTRATKSRLDKINESPSKYKYAMDNGTDDTDPMRFGRSGHAYVLEGVEPEVLPFDSLRTKAAKEWAGARTDWLRQEEYDVLKAQREKLLSIPIVRKWLASGMPETEYHWTDPVTGEPCKCRTDWRPDSENVVIDLKLTADASPRGFRSSIWNYRYDVQAVFYSDGIEEATGVRPDKFIFVCIEKKPPYTVGIYEVDPNDLEEARLTYIEDLRTLKACKESDDWPDYTGDIQIISKR